MQGTSFGTWNRVLGWRARPKHKLN